MVFDRSGLMRIKRKQLNAEELYGGNVLLTDVQTSSMYVLNETAFKMYQLCDGKGQSDIIQDYVNNYSPFFDNKTTLIKDAEYILRCLCAIGVVIRSE